MSKISELTRISTVNGTELIPIVSDGSNKSVNIKSLADFTKSSSGDYLTVKGDDKKTYRVYVKNGKTSIVDEEAYTGRTAQEGDNTLYDGLIINQMYGGGTELRNTPVSHSFIELYNFSDVEMNLKGLYLWYRAKSGNWEKLELVGIVPPKHSFLIRCGKHNDPYASYVRCPILNYDMEWNIKLSDQGFSVYLCIGSETPENNPVRHVKDALGNITSTNGRYIDLLGAGGKLENQTIWAYETRYLKCMDRNTAVHRIDFANSGKKNIGSNALVKGNNEADCEPIDYLNCDVEKYRPRCLADGRWNEFYDKPQQTATSPSMINISYGEEGDTTRCFVFHTPITEEGYVKYRVSGEPLWTTVETTVSIANSGDSHSVHKVKISDLAPATYEYQVGYEGCWSDVATFVVKEYTRNEPINILWTSDQQSWTTREYDVWKICARHLRKNNGYSKYDFHLNTGDISQNAVRTFEWRDYYNYSGELCRNIPHMITCGNNDLVDKKYSDAFQDYFYADNQFANSVHAWDLGYTHFVCLNSNTDSTYVNGVGNIGGYQSTDEFLQAQADWLDTHLTSVNARPTKPRWVIVYAHLSPFTVGRTKRLQRWVSVFEKHKVDLVLCGHNHAYSRSKALYTGYNFNSSPAYNDYVTKISGSSELQIVDEFKADGRTEVNRNEDIANGTVYILNHACGFKLSGKEKPITLPANLQGTKHSNEEGAPWWISNQALPPNPCYGVLNITYDKIEFKFNSINGVVNYDTYKNTILNEDLSRVSEETLDSLTINWSSRNK